MNLSCDKKAFQAALNIASAATSQRTAHVYHQSIRIVAEDAKLTLTGNDGEMWATASCPAEVGDPGEICVQQRLLAEIVGVLPEGTLELELRGTQLWLRLGHGEWLLTTFPADEFPPEQTVSEGASLTLPMGELNAAVESVIYAVSDDSSRQHLTGVLFQYDGNELSLVATDTHRLAVKRLRREGIGNNVDAIVPAKALRAIKQLPVDAETEIVLRLDSERLSVDVGSARVVTQLLSGQYPSWERVVPREFTRQWTVDRNELLDNVRRVLVIGKDNANRIRFSGKDDRVMISARSEDRGEANQEIPAISRNGDVEIAFNGRYIVDALMAMPGDGVVAELTEPSRPAVIRPAEGGEDRFCVVMPMALS
ncbi:MAG: DNA polymerase III subunit beta [Fimbriimonadaceae bacterium]|nr:DNA polymerase III subunit beta [Fimbriimonadaceae bacterium]